MVAYCPFERVAIAYLRLGKPVIPLCDKDHAHVWPGHINGYTGRDGRSHPPCTKPGKAPLIAKWERYGSLLPTEAEIRQWGKQWPHANVGGPTGPLWGIALDIDPQHGGDEQIIARKLDIPDTQNNRTGGGGDHFLFQHPGYSIPNKVALFPGVDVRGDGGQIVLPPSVHVSGREYAWEVLHRPESTSLAPCPEWLIAALSAAPRPQGAAATIPAGKVPVGRRALNFVAFGAPQGKQRAEALAAARSLISSGKAVEEVAEALWRGFQISPQDAEKPWTFEEALAIAQDIADRPPKNEATYLQRSYHPPRKHTVPVPPIAVLKGEQP